jgi:TetR/AcrR family transcriptional regulator, cholesterol catabolism regulator
MDERTLRIISVAMELAERDGYEAVRLRELAAQADVALGTVYKRFSSKEDILAAALQMQVDAMANNVREHPIEGATPRARLDSFFATATQALSQRPKLAGAMLRTVASGVPELSEKVTRFHGRMTEVILAVYRGEWSEDFPSEEEQTLAHLLQNVWFATLVGWTGGLHDQEVVVETVNQATRLLLKGMEAS